MKGLFMIQRILSASLLILATLTVISAFAQFSESDRFTEPQFFTLALEQYWQEDFQRNLPMAIREPVRDSDGNVTGYKDYTSIDVNDTRIVLRSLNPDQIIWLQCDDSPPDTPADKRLYPQVVFQGGERGGNIYRFRSQADCIKVAQLAQSRLVPLEGAKYTIKPPLSLSFRRGPGQPIGQVSVVDADRSRH
jgi:hypothetical protein